MLLMLVIIVTRTVVSQSIPSHCESEEKKSTNTNNHTMSHLYTYTVQGLSDEQLMQTIYISSS